MRQARPTSAGEHWRSLPRSDWSVYKNCLSSSGKNLFTMLIQQTAPAAHAHRREQQHIGAPGALYLPITGCSRSCGPPSRARFCSQSTNWPTVFSGAAARLTRLCLIGEIIDIKLTNKVGERLGDFLSMLITIAGVLPLQPGQRLIQVIQFCANSFHMCGMLVVK